MEIKEISSGFKSTDRPSTGLAMVFDISGFTNFFNKPDIHYYMTNYINHIIECVEINIWGGVDYYNKSKKSQKPISLKPSLRKFLGDGMLYVWEDIDEKISNFPGLKITLINRLWNLQKNFDMINKKLLETLPVGDLPKSVKFGIAQGSVYKLIDTNDEVDYIGPCINLASRLVKYCNEINFIASSRLDLEKSKLERNRYFKIIAKELRSFESEIVIIDKNDYEKVSKEDKKRLFQEI